MNPLVRTENRLHPQDADIYDLMVNGTAGECRMLERDSLIVSYAIPPNEIRAPCGF